MQMIAKSLVSSNLKKASILQDDIDKAIEWTGIWGMPFNMAKCKVIHIGHGTKRSTHQYSICSSDESQIKLAVTKNERDLGVMVSDNLKLKNQVETAASTVNQVLGRLKNHSAVSVLFSGKYCI